MFIIGSTTNSFFIHKNLVLVLYGQVPLTCTMSKLLTDKTLAECQSPSHGIDYSLNNFVNHRRKRLCVKLRVNRTLMACQFRNRYPLISSSQLLLVDFALAILMSQIFIPLLVKVK